MPGIFAHFDYMKISDLEKPIVIPLTLEGNRDVKSWVKKNLPIFNNQYQDFNSSAKNLRVPNQYFKGHQGHLEIFSDVVRD